MSGAQHVSARVEDALTRAHVAVQRRRGHVPAVVPFVSYGNGEWVRLRGRVLLVPPGAPLPTSVESRGWRTFVTAQVPQAPVHVQVRAASAVVTTDRGGYFDVTLPVQLPPGWHRGRASAGGATCSYIPIMVVDGRARVGIVSDIDDTVLSTSVIRPLLAAYNMFVRRESERRPVRGMQELFAALKRAHPTAPVFYLSNGAWNQVGALGRFLSRHGFPAGPLIMTDFGPTPSGWFRIGRHHKRDSLERLASDFPHVRWVLLGDDGQADPQIYREFARRHPGKVRAIAIRHVGTAGQVMASGVPVVAPASRRAMRKLDRSAVRFAVARTGYGLARGLGLRL